MRVASFILLALTVPALLAQEPLEPGSDFERDVWRECETIYYDTGGEGRWERLMARGDIVPPLMRLVERWRLKPPAEPDSKFQQLVSMLGESKDPRAIPALVSLLGPENSPPVSGDCVSALLQIGDPRALDPLHDFVQAALSGPRSDAALDHLSCLVYGFRPVGYPTPLHQKAIPILEEVIGHEGVPENVRESARYAITTIRNRAAARDRAQPSARGGEPGDAEKTPHASTNEGSPKPTPQPPGPAHTDSHARVLPQGTQAAGGDGTRDSPSVVWWGFQVAAMFVAIGIAASVTIRLLRRKAEQRPPL